MIRELQSFSSVRNTSSYGVFVIFTLFTGIRSFYYILPHRSDLLNQKTCCFVCGFTLEKEKAHNAEVFAVREKESRGKIGFALGTAAAAAGSKSELVTGILAKSGKFAPALIIGGETIIDVAVDKGTSVVFDREFDLKMSLLTSLASNIAFSIDPVNMATADSA